MSDHDSSDHEIDIENFSLGPGTWEEKKLRVENFVKKIKDDKHMQKEF
jgi:hypothetical protein